LGETFPPLARAWWILSLLPIGLTSAAMGFSLIHEVVAPARRRPWETLVACKLGVFSIVVVARPAFLIAIADYGLTMVAWLAAALVLRRPWRLPMLAGIAVSIAAAVVQQAKWDPPTRFDHNHLYHVIQGAGIYLFYRAGRSFGGMREP
jgi:hypothetical protein